MAGRLLRTVSRFLLAALLAAALCACGSDGGGPAPDAALDAGDAAAADTGPADADTGADGASDPRTLRIATPDGGPPPLFRVVVGAGEAVHAVTCVLVAGAPPEAVADGPLACAPEGVTVDGPAETLTVRAPGWRTQMAVPFPADGSLTLEPLPDFTATPDYRTGVGAADGLAAFQALAYATQTDLGPVEVVKFVIRLSGDGDDGDGGAADGDDDAPADVYLQNTTRHPLHWLFAQRFMGFGGNSTDFARAAYQGPDRQWMGGTLVYHPTLTAESAALGRPLAAPVALTFFPSDDLTPAQARLAWRLLDERLGCLGLDGADRRLVYVPAGVVQEAQLRADAAAFARADVPWMTQTELYGGLTEQLLNPGVAYGTLRRLTPEALATEVVSFRDVLVLTRLPNELPVVGGTITEELQTPLAHVNVAARSRGTPNLALLGAGSDPRVAPLLGELVRFEVTGEGFTLAATTLAEAQAFWDGHGGEPFVPAADLERGGLPGFAELGFADAVAVGAKAANIAELRHLLGEEAPDGFAVPFRYYEEFLATAEVTPARCAAARADCVGEGRAAMVCAAAEALCQPPGGSESVRAWLERLLADPDVAADSTLREAALDGVRHVLRHVPLDPTFAATLDARVAAVFGAEPARLRSSTNAEDLRGFSGAGLYDSLTVSDDERASEEIRKVWASVWNWRAFEERAFWSIDHLAVRMGVAVHPAFPDEAANGVLITQNIADPTMVGMYVNVQLGEVSVTNPEGGALPEIFSLVARPGGGAQVQRQRYSSLSPDAPILTDEEVQTLFAAAAAVQRHFAPLYEVDATALALDIEFKFHGPERAFLVKQVRPYGGGGLP